jgi:hypothetical protein
MAPILFRCPATGLNVQWETDQVKPDDERAVPYQGITCPACTRLHFINRSTGKLLGENDPLFGKPEAVPR